MKEPIVLYDFADLDLVAEDSLVNQEHMLLIGPERLGKTQAFKRHYRDKTEKAEADDKRKPVAWLQGRETAARLYVDLFNARQEDTFLGNDLELVQNADHLLKQGMETLPGIDRTIRWGVQQSIRLGRGKGARVIPSAFESALKLILIANALPQDTANWSAVVGRTDYFAFFPKLDTILRYCHTWVDDSEVLGKLEEQVNAHPEAASIDLEQVARACRKKSSGSRLVLSDGVPLWLETLRRSLVFGNRTHQISDLDRLLSKWADRIGRDEDVSLGRLAVLMGWRKDRLLPVLDLAIKAMNVQENTPQRRNRGKGRQPESAFRLVG